MNQTSLFHKRDKMSHAPLENCHGGTGALDWIGVLEGELLKGRRLNFIHDDVLAPGVSIGIHPHEKDEEYYYILSGHGRMTLDDKVYEVRTGDITAVFPGGIHGLENAGKEDLRVIVISVAM